LISPINPGCSVGASSISLSLLVLLTESSSELIRSRVGFAPHKALLIVKRFC